MRQRYEEDYLTRLCYCRFVEIIIFHVCLYRGSQIVLTGGASGLSATHSQASNAGEKPVTSATGKKKTEGCEELDCETRLQRLEDRWQELNALPTNSEMFRRLRKFKAEMEGISEPVESNLQEQTSQTSNACPPPLHRTGQPMSELWHSMQLLSQVETNTEGITRVSKTSVSLCPSVISVLPPAK